MSKGCKAHFKKLPDNNIYFPRLYNVQMYNVHCTMQCFGSAKVFMRIRIRIQDPKHVHMDPDRDAYPDPILDSDPRG